VVGAPAQMLQLRGISGEAMAKFAFNRIPNDLKSCAQFVVWRYEFRDGNPKPTKVPYSARTLQHASVTDSSTWATFEEAVAACAPKANGTASGFNGIGFVFTEGDPFAGIDLDPSNDPSIIERQNALFIAFESYSERSPSGQGLHIIVRGKVPSGRRRDCVEVYSSRRFFTMTGDIYHDAPIADRQAELDKLFGALGGTMPKAPALPLVAATASDDDILRRMFSAANGETIQALYNGDASALKGNDRSGSAIDQALVDHIQFYTSNRDQIERIWLNSPHGQRDKTQSRTAYRKRTIDRAFDRELSISTG
jgi:primase-polymerase (primpol)-like protein